MTEYSEPERFAPTRAPTYTAAAAVIGGGPAGLVAALALAHFGVPTVLVAPPPGRAANRTTALMRPSVKALEPLSQWSSCQYHASPPPAMRIPADTGALRP